MKQGSYPRFFVKLLGLGVALLFLVLSTECSGQVSSCVCGFITLHVRGTGYTNSSALSFLGLGLTRSVMFRGNLESFGPGTITDLQAHWTDNQFNGTNGLHYLEITSGSHAGFLTDILDTDAASHTLTLAHDLSSVLSGGETYTIRKHWTLASLFGPHDEAGLGAGSNVSADEILIYNPATGLYTTYFYKTLGLGGTGWRSTASSSFNQASAQLDLTQGILIKRKQGSNLEIKIFGTVKTGPTMAEVQPGLNILGNVYPIDTLTLGNSCLYTGNLNTGLAAGSNVSADKVLIYDGLAYQTYYYKTLGLGGIGWRSTASSSRDASGTILPAGSSILIQRINNAGFLWQAAQPF